MERLYGSSYAEQYASRALKQPYTAHKNVLIADEAAFHKAPSVLDVGGNVNGLIKEPSSLRFQLEERGIKYFGLDLSPDCFNRDSIGNSPSNQGRSLYPEVEAVVGDASQLPFANGSLKCIVCADVIEHIPQPQKVLEEIGRKVDPYGVAIVVTPAFYKLDMFKFPYIKEKRCSTHENKFSLAEWTDLFKQAGLDIILRRTRPIGTLSGLSYLVWLDADFIPERKNLDESGFCSPNAALHREAKRALSEIDPQADKYYAQNPGQLHKLLLLLQDGDLSELTRIVTETACSFAKAEEAQAIRDCFGRFKPENISGSRLNQLQSAIRETRIRLPGEILVGNSTLWVLRRTSKTQEPIQPV